MFIELRPLEPLVSEDVIFEVFFTDIRMYEWLDETGLLPFNDIYYSISVSTVERTDIFSGNVTVEFILYSLRFKLLIHIPTSVYDHILSIHNTNLTVSMLDNDTRIYQATINPWYVSPAAPFNTLTYQILNPAVGWSDYTTQTNTGNEEDNIDKITPFYSCPHLVLDINEFSISGVEERFRIGVYDYMVTVEDIYIEDGMAFICLETAQRIYETYLLKTHSIPTTKDITTGSSTSDVLTESSMYPSTATTVASSGVYGYSTKVLYVFTIMCVVYELVIVWID